MNAPRDLGPDFRSWLRDVPEAPADLPARTVAQTRHTRQRRRWLWFLPGPKPTAEADQNQDRDERAAPMIEPTGGTRTMFSATKMVAIAAAIALYGAVMLAGSLNQPPDAPVPGAPAFEPGEITPISGTLRVLGQDNAGMITRYDWGETVEGEQWTVRITTDDPRFSGVNTGYHNLYAVGPDSIDLRTYNGRFFTKEGSWLTTGRGYQNPLTGGIQYQEYAIGEGALEGLSAITSCGQEQFSNMFQCEGVIFEGGLPEMPAEAPADIPAIHGGP